MDSIDSLQDAAQQLQPTRVDPHPSTLDELGAKLLHATLAVVKPTDLWQAGSSRSSVYALLFDVYDVLRHAFILEQLGKARFSTPILQVKWSWSVGFSMDAVTVEWVDPNVSEDTFWGLWGQALEILKRWNLQLEIQEADEKIRDIRATQQRLDASLASWRKHKAKLEEKLSCTPKGA